MSGTERCRLTSSALHTLLFDSTEAGSSTVDPMVADLSIVARRSNVERSVLEMSIEISIVSDRLKLSVRFECESSITL